MRILVPVLVEMTDQQVKDYAQERGLPRRGGHVTRVWGKPARDPYVTILSEGRTFVRISSAVTVTRKADAR
jgi:hypothetical protein